MALSRLRFGYRSSSGKEKEALIKIWAGSLVAVGAAYWWLIHTGLWGYLWSVVWHNFPIWLVLAATTGYGIFWWKKHENFSRAELVVFFVLMPFFVYPATALSYFFFTDLHDIEIWNGYAVSAEYVERYYTEGPADEDGDRDRTYHGPYYYIYTNNGERDRITTGEAAYKAYVARWGPGRVTSRRNSDADSLNYIYTITWDGALATRVPTANEHWFVNYVKSSRTILKTRGAMSGYQSLLHGYPRVRDTHLGKVDVDRVIEAGVQVPGDFARVVNRELTDALCELGHRKEVNLLVYVVASDVGFFHALEEFWCMGKKNDVIVVIGSNDGTTISWAKVMAWTDHFVFKEALGARVMNLKTLPGHGKELAQAIVDQVNKSGDEGFRRQKMTDFNYLLSEISMPWWAYVPMLLVIFAFLLPTMWIFIHD